MFDRYNIIDEQDLARAVGKRFDNDKQAGKHAACRGCRGIAKFKQHIVRPGSSVG
jgi:hypothetical protein